MNKESQRIAMAELCGWTKCRMTIKGSGAPERRASPYGVPPGKNYEASIPDYLSDRNAMAEVTSVDDNYVPIHNFNLAEYVRHLAAIVHAEIDEDPDAGDFFLIANATAAQCAEAILRATGRWIEEKL